MEMDADRRVPVTELAPEVTPDESRRRRRPNFRDGETIGACAGRRSTEGTEGINTVSL